MPPEFAHEIETTNFTELAMQADNFVRQNLLPTLNKELANGYQIEDNSKRQPPMLCSSIVHSFIDRPFYSVAKYLYRPEIGLHDGFAFIGFGIRNPTTKAN
jgi:hypothetical protein